MTSFKINTKRKTPFKKTKTEYTPGTDDIVSKLLPLNKHKSTDPIILIQQFYIDKNPKRQREITFCLQKNCSNTFIHAIYLLNERLYTKKELGIINDNDFSKIKQIVTKQRLSYKKVFDFIDELKGFIIFSNSDMIINDTIENLLYSNLSTQKSVIALTRYEYKIKNTRSTFEENCNSSILKSNGHQSQDTWIIHSNFNIPKYDRRVFDFNFGVPGCDNHLVFLLFKLNYEVFNTPSMIKTYHHHTSQIRNYNQKNRIRKPYKFLHPV